MIVVMSVVALAEPPAKRDKLAIIHKLGAFAVGCNSAGPATLERSGSRAPPPIG